MKSPQNNTLLIPAELGKYTISVHCTTILYVIVTYKVVAV